MNLDGIGLVLGTAKLGMPDYGLSRHVTTAAERDAILAGLGPAWIGIDTAQAYGDAEDWIKERIQRLGRCWLADPSYIISKILPVCLSAVSSDHRRTLAQALADHSDEADLLLTHDVRDIDPAIITILRGEGEAGCSVYTPDEARRALAAGALYLQLPYSAVNRENAAVIAEAKAAGVTVAVRSVFAQGLLTRELGELKPGCLSAQMAYAQFEFWRACYRAKRRDILSRLAPLVAALGAAALVQPDHLVLGVDTVEDVKGIEAAWAALADVPVETIQAIADAYQGEPIRFPSLWAVK